MGRSRPNSSRRLMDMASEVMCRCLTVYCPPLRWMGDGLRTAWCLAPSSSFT